MSKYASRGSSASRLFRCLQYDCIAGFRFTVVPLFAVAVLCFALFTGAFGYSRFFHIDVSGMLASDVLGLVLAGAPRFEWRPGLLARLPLGWLALMGFTLYASLVYPVFDLRALGGQISALRGFAAYMAAVKDVVGWRCDGCSGLRDDCRVSADCPRIEYAAWICRA